jgi:hypothetical protein
MNVHSVSIVVKHAIGLTDSLESLSSESKQAKTAQDESQAGRGQVPNKPRT